jgi:hypothetical protein
MAEASPRFKARMAGVFQLLEALTATFPGLFVLGRLVVSGSGAATAANILGHERLFWLGFASSLIGVACHIAWALLMYELLKPVNRSVFLFAALVILGGMRYSGSPDLSGVLRSLVPPDRLPHFQVNLPASSSGSAGSDQWFGLGNLSRPAARTLSVALHRCRLCPRGNTIGVWLIVMGLNVQRWKEQASAAGMRI